MRHYASAVTTARVCLHAARMGAWATRIGEARVLTIGDARAYASGEIFTDIPAWNLFGGAVELLAYGAIVQTVISTAYVVNLEKNTTNLTQLSVTNGTARGGYIEQLLTASADTLLTANDNLSMEVVSGGTGAVGTWYIRYRRLD